MRFLCVSDIHGHADELKDVIEASQAQFSWDKLICCGDLLFPGPKPLETWKLLIEHQALVTQGLVDRAIAELEPERIKPKDAAEEARLSQLFDLHEQLGELIVMRLGKLPVTARLPLENGDEMLIVHGSPMDPTESFSPELSEDEMNALIGDDPADIILCGGSHVAFDWAVGETRIVNVGSVGEAPGGGYSAYTVIETTPLGISVEQLTI
ncbi:MAG: metallophosphoesterase family protein [Polyangiaceae bacterium]|nr:metallophosphoesterase family protein [Polyangiaceae bacterium]